MKIFIICGKARSGKDTVAKMIDNYYQKKNKKVLKMHFALYLKMYAKNYFNYSSDKDKKPRKFLQYLGTDIIRLKLKKDKFLINRIIEDIEIMKEFFDIFVIGDARFVDEIEDIKNNFSDCVSIYIKRDEDNKLSEELKNHLSETSLDNYHNYDYVINNQSLEDLEKDVYKILRSEDQKYEKNDK